MALLALLTSANVWFYTALPEDYLSFLLNEAVILLLVRLNDNIRKAEGNIELERLMSLDELYDYYLSIATSDTFLRSAYQALIQETKLPGYRWIPGIIEKTFEGRVLLEPMVGRERIWRELLDDIIRPSELRFRRLFSASGWNELKVRPIGITEVNGYTLVTVEPTSYYYSYITNFSSDMALGNDVTLRRVLEPLFILPRPGRPLATISESKDLPISNHVGINMLIVTADGYIPLPRRSFAVTVEQNVFAHPIAGSLDWKALQHLASTKGKVDLAQLSLQEIAEAEELSSMHGDYIIYPVALTRNLRFLGKPDFQLIAAFNGSLKSLLKDTKLGKKLEIIDVAVVKVHNSRLHRVSKCELLELVSETLAEPLLRGEKVEATRYRGRKRIEVNYDMLSSNLILGLYSYVRAYQELCRGR